MRIIQSLKSLQASLRNLDVDVPDRSPGGNRPRSRFYARVSDAFNSMTQQLKTSFQERDEQHRRFMTRWANWPTREGPC